MHFQAKAAVRRAAVGLALLAFFGWGAASAWAAGPNSVKELTREAEFVFRGTILKPGAANLEIVEPNERTAVVRVDEVLKAADTLDDFTGREVTVFLRGRAMKAGNQRIFFTRVGLIGETLGVQEIGRLSGRASDAKALVATADRRILEEDLAARLAEADLAVSGRVASTRAASREPQSGVFSEHDPLWEEAVLEVKEVLRGQVAAATVAFWFPTGRDVMWAAVPKPGEGQEGTWLLHRYETEAGKFVYAILSPQDLLSKEEEEIVHKGVRP
jgi:hypothetical protein